MGKCFAWLFALTFILCGIGHLDGFLSFSWPAYRLFLIFRTLGAIVAVPTVYVIWFVLRRRVSLMIESTDRLKTILEATQQTQTLRERIDDADAVLIKLRSEIGATKK